MEVVRNLHEWGMGGTPASVARAPAELVPGLLERLTAVLPGGDLGGDAGAHRGQLPVLPLRVLRGRGGPGRRVARAAASTVGVLPSVPLLLGGHVCI